MVVVSDTSPIRGLAFLGLMDLLERLFGTVLVLPAVERELALPTRWSPAIRFEGLSYIIVKAPVDRRRIAELLMRLDPGEAEALALALEVRATSVLMDESEGRSVAEELGLVPFGLMGILLRAKKRGYVAKVRPLIVSLREDAGFFLSQSFCEDIFREAGE